MALLPLLHMAFISYILATSLAAAQSSVNKTCDLIAKSISSASDVYFPGSAQYAADNFHFANSSSQASVCSVEPGTSIDVGTILNILGQTRTPFGVKGGGHAFNPNFSSTAGVQISLTRFNQINVNLAEESVEIGTGLIWDDVYLALDPQNLTVIGGRVTGVGVAGFVLGGGLSYKTNEYGIATANVIEFELVLPNGTVANIDTKSDPDLFFAVRGTQNNFGIVTSITMKTLPQGLIWGGTIAYALNTSTTSLIINALINYQNNITDPKAAVNFIIQYTGGELIFEGVLFYDNPEPPAGVFDEFLAIPSLSANLSIMHYSELPLLVNGNATLGYRTADDHIMVEKFTEGIFEAIMNETVFWTKEAQKIDPNAQLPYILEIFLPSMFQHGDTGAWPPLGTSSPALLPLASQWSWTSSPDTDEWFIDALQGSLANLAEIVWREGQNSSLPRYINYAITGTPVTDIWGEDNIQLLQRIQVLYDPEDVMGLTGGFKIPKVTSTNYDYISS